MRKGVVGDNEETFGIARKLELRFFLSYIMWLVGWLVVF